jgi:magnesium chelatase family protein
MQLAIIKTRAMLGMQAPEVTVEVHLSFGIPNFNIVGLPETTVKESKDRVRSAILNSHFEFPDKKIVVNLAPGDLPKHGSRFDLAIAIGILAASGQVSSEHLANVELIGELALTGQLRSVKGLLPFAIQCKAENHTLIFPQENYTDIEIIRGMSLFAANHLLDVCHWLSEPHPEAVLTEGIQTQKVIDYHLDYAEVKGQAQAKKALEIAAAGGHNVLMVGSPGSGKTMLAARLMTILPDLRYDEAMEVAAIYSLAEITHEHLLKRPFRTPHHTSSHVALVGGGRPPKPGEISLAHKGILFLDELPEFSRHALETLRQPLESKKIHISRAGFQAEFPAEFQLMTAMNPCPCGHYGDTRKSCSCSPDQVKRYQDKISGPLLERIDIHIEVNSIAQENWFNTDVSESSADIKARVIEANARQMMRQGKQNSMLSVAELKTHCQLCEKSQTLLEKAGIKYRLSMRSIHRVLKVARSIADLDKKEMINEIHLAKALTLRMALEST